MLTKLHISVTAVLFIFASASPFSCVADIYDCKGSLSETKDDVTIREYELFVTVEISPGEERYRIARNSYEPPSTENAEWTRFASKIESGFLLLSTWNDLSTPRSETRFKHTIELLPRSEGWEFTDSNWSLIDGKTRHRFVNPVCALRASPPPVSTLSGSVSTQRKPTAAASEPAPLSRNEVERNARRIAGTWSYYRGPASWPPAKLARWSTDNEREGATAEISGTSEPMKFLVKLQCYRDVYALTAQSNLVENRHSLSATGFITLDGAKAAQGRIQFRGTLATQFSTYESRGLKSTKIESRDVSWLIFPPRDSQRSASDSWPIVVRMENDSSDRPMYRDESDPRVLVSNSACYGLTPDMQKA